MSTGSRNAHRRRCDTMVIKVLTIDLHLPGRSSLKEKRFVMSSLKSRLTGRFNVAVAEIDFHDKWQRSMIAIVTVGNDGSVVESTCEKVLRFVEQDRRVSILDYFQELR